MSAEPTIDIQVLPHSQGMSQSFGFHILAFGESDRVVFIDVPPNGLFLEDADDLLEHERAFDQLHAAALSPADSQSFLNALLDEYKKER